MSLIINQGKQDISQDNQDFELMVSANELAQIIKMELKKDWPDTIEITFKVISEGKYKGRQFWDRVTFDPKSQFSWKYRNLRKAAGCPYTEGENAKIDIEALLLNKAVNVELGTRKGTDGNDYQKVTYKVSKTDSTKEQKKPTETVVEAEEAPFEDVNIDPETDTDVEW